MTLVRFNNKPASRSFNNFMDDFFTGVPSIFRDEQLRSFTPVNIRETENEYIVDLVAPGFEKEDFKVSLENNVLTISGEKKTEAKKENEKQILREYQHQSFKRSFTIDDQVNAQNIVAKYINGVLTLNLPKREEVKTSIKEISIQ